MTNKTKDRFPNYETICLQCGGTIYKPLRELSDEEIDNIENAIYCKTIQKGKTPHEYIMTFARAILKKAQE